MNRPPVVIGVDIGTTSTKIVAYDPTGARRADCERAYRLDEPQPEYAVQDAPQVLDAVVSALGDTVAELHRQGLAIAGVGLSSAMHSLIALDREGTPLTPSITWADLRATEQAERLRPTAAGRELHRRTGTPVHPMSPLVKLMWFHENHPALVAGAARWAGIKEYVLGQLTDECVMDRSIASATGLLSWKPQPGTRPPWRRPASAPTSSPRWFPPTTSSASRTWRRRAPRPRRHPVDRRGR